MRHPAVTAVTATIVVLNIPPNAESRIRDLYLFQLQAAGLLEEFVQHCIAAGRVPGGDAVTQVGKVRRFDVDSVEGVFIVYLRRTVLAAASGPAIFFASVTCVGEN